MFHFGQRLSRTLIALSLIGIPASAARISIDSRGGNPVVENDIPANIEWADDRMVILFSLLVGNEPIAVGARSVILLDQPDEGGGPSDFATLTAEAPLEGVQVVVLFFQSNGAPAFEGNVAALPPDTPRIRVTGDFQDVSGPELLDTSPALTVVLASGINPPIPEPGAFAMLAMGLLGITVAKRLPMARQR